MGGSTRHLCLWPEYTRIIVSFCPTRCPHTTWLQGIHPCFPYGTGFPLLQFRFCAIYPVLYHHLPARRSQLNARFSFNSIYIAVDRMVQLLTSRLGLPLAGPASWPCSLSADTGTTITCPAGETVQNQVIGLPGNQSGAVVLAVRATWQQLTNLYPHE